MRALFYFQIKRGPFLFGLALLGKAPGITPPAAFSKYKDPWFLSSFFIFFSHLLTVFSLFLVL